MLSGITPNIINAIYTEIVDNNVENLNLETLFTSNQRNSFKTKRVIIKNSAAIYSMTRSLNALNTGSNWNGLLEIVNYGGIYGAAGINSGDSGGNACIAQYASTKLINRGNIWSGGGAGGNGGNGGSGYYDIYTREPTTGDYYSDPFYWSVNNRPNAYWLGYGYLGPQGMTLVWKGDLVFYNGAGSVPYTINNWTYRAGAQRLYQAPYWWEGDSGNHYNPGHAYWGVYRDRTDRYYTNGGTRGISGRGQGYDGVNTSGANGNAGGTNAGNGGRGGDGGTWGMPGQNGASGGNGNNGSGGPGIVGGLAGYAYSGFNQVSNLGSVLGRI